MRVLLPHLDSDNRARAAFAGRYDEALRDMVRADMIALPPRFEGCVYYQYAITSQMRDGVQRRLTEAGIGTSVHYPLPLHRQRAFNGGEAPGDDFAPNADFLACSLLSLPIQPELAQYNKIIFNALGAALLAKIS